MIGRIAFLLIATLIHLRSQSFSPTQVDPWPTQADPAAKPYLRYSFASQGAQGLKDGAGGLPHGFQVVHVTILNRSAQAVDVSGAAVYQAAVFAGFLPLGPATAAAVLEGPSRRGKWAVLTRLLDVAPAGTAIGLAAVHANPNAQLVNGGAQLLIAYLRSGLEARRVDPKAAVSRILDEGLLLSVRAGAGWGGDIGALFKGQHVAVLVDQFADGSFSISGAMENGRQTER